MRILLVEDEERMGKLLVRGLSEEGHAVDWVVGGAQALERAAATAYDVIVLDWALPDLDGLHVLRTLREAGLRAPVMMLTARGTIGERVLGLRAGADDYLPKPFDFEELLDHEGDTLTRADLRAAVWGEALDVTPNVVDVYVGYLRQKLRAAGGDPGLIVAVRGLGYRLLRLRAGAPP